MSLCLRLLMPAGVLLLLLSSIAGACGGDDELTLEEFYEQGDAIDDDYGERFDRLPDRYSDADPESLQVREAFYSEYSVIFSELIGELETLNPPFEAEDAFDELLKSGSEYGEFLQELSDRFGKGESLTEVEQFFREGSESFGRYRQACQSLQIIAHANGVVVRFDCGFIGHEPGLGHLPRPEPV